MRQLVKEATLDFFKDGAKTYYDLAEEFNCTYYTARGRIQELVQAGLIEELPDGGENGRVSFTLVVNGRDKSAMRITPEVKGRVFTLGEIIKMYHEGGMSLQPEDNVTTKPYEMLAYLYRRSEVLKSIGGSWDSSPMAAQGGRVDPESIRIKLRRARDILIRETRIIEQVLLRTELFDDSIVVADLFGIEDEDTRNYVVELGVHYVQREGEAG